MYIIAVLILATAIGLGVNHAFKLPPDNPIEEASEAIIEKELGMPKGSVDITPGTPETETKKAKV